MKSVGFNNFVYMFQDPSFWQVLINNVAIWLLANGPMLAVALVVAFVINMSIVKFKGFFRIAFFLPNITAMVAVVIIFQSMFGNQYGLINFFLEKLGLVKIAWFNSSAGVRIVIAAMIAWRYMGYNAVIFLSGFKGFLKICMKRRFLMALLRSNVHENYHSNAKTHYPLHRHDVVRLADSKFSQSLKYWQEVKVHIQVPIQSCSICTGKASSIRTMDMRQLYHGYCSLLSESYPY